MSTTHSVGETAFDDKSSPNITAQDHGRVPALTIDGQSRTEEDAAPNGKVTASMSDYFTLLASGFGRSSQARPRGADEERSYRTASKTTCHPTLTSLSRSCTQRSTTAPSPLESPTRSSLERSWDRLLSASSATGLGERRQWWAQQC